ncbi:MAG: S1C family serine protease [Candidatus Dormibacteria bacterium]
MAWRRQYGAIDDEVLLPPPPPPPPRRRLPLRGVGIVAAAAVVGGAIGHGLLEGRGAGVAEVEVNSSPVAVAGAASVEVARRLGPAVGTVVAKLVGANSLGSGFVMARGDTVSYLVTNNHVVAGATSIHVVMPGGAEFSATLVGADALDDIAVLSVPSTSLPVAVFGSSASLRVGQPVIAIGSPLGDQGSVTVGVISALHRTITANGEGAAASEHLEDVLQTDAAINPGNSGGPLADTSADVVGVNVATAGNSTNIGYSIPADLARSVAESLIQHHAVQHPFLGIGYLDSIAAIEAGTPFDGPGVLVHTVSPGTPAARAGFRVGDILVSIDGTAIDNGQTLGGILEEKQVGETIHCVVRRGGSTLTLTPTLVERPTT